MNRVLAVAAIAACSGSALAQPEIGTLYGIDGLGNELIEINTTTGAGTLIGVSSARVGLAINGSGQAVARGFTTLYDIDLITGATSNPRPISAGTALEYSADSSTLYGLTGNRLDISSIDESTGVSTQVASIAPDPAISLAVNRDNGNFFVADLSDLFREVNPLDGSVVSSVNLVFNGTIGKPEVGLTSIATDADNNLFGVGLRSDNLFSIDPATGIATSVGFLGADFADIRGLAFVVPSPGAFAAFLGFAGLATARRRRA